MELAKKQKMLESHWMVISDLGFPMVLIFLLLEDFLQIKLKRPTAISLLQAN